MAGMKHYKVAMDPGIVRLATLSTNRFRYFRWTPRTAWINFAFIVLVPSMLGVLAYSKDGKYNFRAKRRGDTILEY
ncbi:hypothetical protein BD289DRAFT_478345 [Coniella lustricola]|uniref:NADH-ubiquinone oxidoreductase B15 subunit n=1 Tax=Coniella lustricola TaxID=2025994 RepID=A0A2T3ANC1_9PEZI|nr:hypothetical protein BD289DRAFT_478345 [Coniella lustricola]